MIVRTIFLKQIIYGKASLSLTCKKLLELKSYFLTHFFLAALALVKLRIKTINLSFSKLLFLVHTFILYDIYGFCSKRWFYTFSRFTGRSICLSLY